MEETKRTGIVYLMTNNLFSKEGFYKFGCSANPFQRMKIQRNCTPPTHAFYYVAVIFSESYREIENELKVIFTEKDWIDKNEKGLNGGFEWLDYKNVTEIVDVYKNVIRKYEKTKLCSNGVCFEWENDTLKERRNPNCDMHLIGIKDGTIIKLTENAKKLINYKGENAFLVSGSNSIIVDNENKTLSNFMISQLKQNKGTDGSINGFLHFSYKGIVINDLWKALTETHF